MAKLSPTWRVLDWDSSFFGFRVGTVLAPRLETGALRQILCEAQREAIRLLYWPSDPADVASQEAAMAMDGDLVDRKTTFSKKIPQVATTSSAPALQIVEEYLEKAPNTALVALALQSGVWSRFNVDPNFPRDLFKALYREWIRKSASRELADAILIVRAESDIAGMVTVAKRSGLGEIGLVAVDDKMRGRGLGEILIGAADRWFAGHDCREWRVVTQGNNQAACRLYKKCGCSVTAVSDFYHFWL